MLQREAIPKFNLKNINKKVDVKKLKEVIWKDLREKNDDRKKSRDESIISEAGDNEVSIGLRKLMLKIYTSQKLINIFQY